MLPLLTFASGLVAGIVGVRLLKSANAPERLRNRTAAAGAGLGVLGDKVRHGVDQAQASLRQAAAAGLDTVEKSSASLRARVAEAEPAKPATKPTRRRIDKPEETAAPAKSAPTVRKVAAADGDKPKRPRRKAAKPPKEPSGDAS